MLIPCACSLDKAKQCRKGGRNNMLSVIIPIAVLLILILVKKIPKIGGNVPIALLITAVLALVLSKIFNPIDWLLAFVDGLDRIAWVIALAVFGSIYAECQNRLGAIGTVMNTFRAMFGHSPKGLVICVILVLVIGGSLLGGSVAACTVVGVLMIPSLIELGLNPVQISAILLMGGEFGSIMPPITQGLFQSAALIGIDPNEAMPLGYITTLIGLVLVCIYVCIFYMKGKKMKEELIPKESAGQILKENWKSLIPLCLLFVLILLNSLFSINIIGTIFKPVLTALSGIKIIKGISNLTVFTLIVVTALCFVSPKVHKNAGELFVTAIKNVRSSILVCGACGLMLGAFYAGGQIDAIKAFATSLSPNVMKIGGALAVVLIGMLTGSQTTAQNTIVSFFGPSLVEVGVQPTHAVIACSNLAAAGQAAPPACIIAFVIAGLVGGIVKGEKPDPVKIMIASLPMIIYNLIIGVLFMYI